MNESEKKQLFDGIERITIDVAAKTTKTIEKKLTDLFAPIPDLSRRLKDLEHRADGAYGNPFKNLASETAMTDVRARLERLEKDNELLREQVRDLAGLCARLERDNAMLQDQVRELRRDK
jgi:hypothetical protein